MIEQFPGALATLPTTFPALTPKQRAALLLTLKATDAERYAQLRAVALRCAR